MGGKEASRRADSQSPSYSALPARKLEAPRLAQPELRTPKQGPDPQASRVMSRVPGALGHRLGRGPRSESRWRGEVGREGRGGKSLQLVEG